MTIQAFYNNPQLQTKFLDRVQKHYDADEIIKGTYWKNEKGCAIGCMVHSSNHKDLETVFGIPEWIAKLIDVLFEGMEYKHSKEFVLEFAKTVSKKSFLGFRNWNHIYHQICLHMLKKECKNIDHPLVKQEIRNIINLHETEETDEKKWSIAMSVIRSTTKLTLCSATELSVMSDSKSSVILAAEEAMSIWFIVTSAMSESSAILATEEAMSDRMSDTYKSILAIKSATTKSIADKLLKLLEMKK